MVQTSDNVCLSQIKHIYTSPENAIASTRIDFLITPMLL